MRPAPALAAAVALGVIAAGVAAASLWWPFQSDHGVYAWMADVVIAGGMPYRDAWDVKGPSALMPALVAELLFGRNMWGVRALDLIVLAAAGWALYRIVGRWLGPVGGAIGAFFWILLYTRGGFGDTAQPDGFWGMLLLLSLAPLLGPHRPSPRALLFAGACIGFLTLLKPIYGAFLLLPILSIRGAASDDEPAGSVAAIAIGFVLPLAAILGWIAARGTLDAFLDAYITFNAAKNSAGLPSGFFATLSDGVLADPFWLALTGAAAAGFLLLRPQEPRVAWVLGGWIAIALVLVHLQRPYYLYRTHMLSPPLVVLAAFAFGQSIAIRGAGRTLALAIGTALALAAARPAVGHTLRWAWHYPGPGDPESLQASQAFLSTAAAGERRLIAAIASHSAPGDSVYAFRHPSVYFLADRPAASRFSILAAFGANAPAEFVPRHLEELGAALERTRPAVIALPDSAGADACLGCFEPLVRIPATASALAPFYRLLHRADGFAVFVRVPSTGTAPQ